MTSNRWQTGKDGKAMKRPLFFVCICLTALIAVWTFCFDAPPLDRELPVEGGSSVTVTGQICKKENRSWYGTEKTDLYLKAIQIINSDTGQVSILNPSYKIICETEAGHEVFKMGRRVTLLGEWTAFEHAANEGQFDSADYYFSQNIVGKMKNAAVQKAEGAYWPLRESLFKLREILKVRLYQALPEKEASILAKMLLGESSGLDQDIKTLYQRNGIVHILSISGLHITMIGMGVYRLLRKAGIPIGPSAAVGTVLLLLYGAMTGFGISCCRAIGMYLIRMGGEVLGRSYDLLTALGILLTWMVCSSNRLLYHSGFLLSFGSVCGIGCLYPILPLEGIKAGRKTLPPPLWWRFLVKRFGGVIRGLWASTAISLFTLPVTLYYFYEVPVYGPFVNLLVLPFMGLVMVLGILLMCFPALPLAGWMESAVFHGFERVCLAAETLPGHTWVAGQPSIWQILLYYGLLFGIIWLCHHKSCFFAAALVGAVLLLGADVNRQDTVAFLDVGQGDCIVVLTETGNAYLFDGGSSSEKSVGEKVILPFLKYHGVSELECVVLSHPDEDHINGVEELVSAQLIPIKQVLLPEVGMGCQEDFSGLLETLKGQHVAYYGQGDWITDGDLTITCLHPYRGFEGESNAYSGCFLLENGAFQVLLTGDVEGVGETLLLQELKERDVQGITVLKAAHHGSNYASSGALLAQLTPRLTVISCARENSYGHPGRETLERIAAVGSDIFCTMEEGQITVSCDERGIRVRTYGK